ncbi:sensor histidine kinase [uncultured Intestinimonas sp.]|uniref:sensor histidine kinase n=1 Tax=uncultured Intestinimonas sp. TaxID=1689265 RepID=UPI0025F0AB5D|nr:sensor histidine kinase [uncultured Intestinimonas sp.]
MGELMERCSARLARGSIRYAMFASFTVSALLAVALTGVTLYVRFSAQLSAAIREENQMLVEQVNQSLSTYLRDMIRLSDSICYNVVKNTDLDQRPVSEEMRLLYNTYSDYVENMVLFTGDGQVVATAPAARVRPDAEITGAPWFTSAMARTENLHFGVPAIQTLFEDAGHNYKWVVSLSCAVELTQGGDTQLGVLLIDLKYSALTALFQSVKLSGSGYLYLTAGDGALIYHPERPLIASGLVHESNLDAAGRPDGIYTETWEGRRRSVIVQAVGYTGWKVVGVVDQPRFTFGSGSDLLFVAVIFCAYLELVILLNVFLSKRLTGPIQKLKASVSRVKEGPEAPPIYVGGSSETRELGTAIQGMVDRIRQLADGIVREHEEKVKSERNALQAQINPHFLYNTLDIIVWMIENGQREEAVRAVTALARFFRVSLSSGRNIIPVRDELEHVRSYLLIQEMRYKNKFRYSIDCQPEAQGLSTIKLVVQPIVENAIYHSMDFMDGDGRIDIRAEVQDGRLTITVSDNGLGMPPQVVARLLSAEPPGDAPRRERGRKGSGIGLRNVQERIRLYFGPEYGVSIQSEPDEGTTVTLRMPAVPYGEMEDA